MDSHQLDEQAVLRLLEVARGARLRAYAPYSSYRVGAAALCEDGHIYGGCNVENASYGLTVCAERVALFGSIAAGAGKPKMLAVVTEDGGSPCGACRQVMVEFNPQMTVVIAAADSDEYRVTTAEKLLPDSFQLKPDSPK